jgi:chloramphenicol 3-O-phosphotransferase
MPAACWGEAWVDPSQPGAFLAALAGIPVRTVLVRCDLAVAERRERDRHPHDGIPLGTAREPHERHVTDFPFDLVVDTTTATPEQTAAALLPLLQQPHREAGRDMP